MKVSERGIDLIKKFEGLELKAYLCSANVLTIGYGHTANVSHDAVITEAQATQYLRHDLTEVERALEKHIEVPLSQNQYDALASFIFNFGASKFRKSTLIKKLNTGDYQGAAEEFPRWVKADGKTSNGLVKRRAAERELFLL